MIEHRERRCVWCGTWIPPKKRGQALYCTDKCRREAFKERPCFYCGMAADTRDHVLPQSFTRTMADLGARKSDVVPCCRECNSLAGSKVFPTISEKRKYIKQRLRKKYEKVLEYYNYSSQEIEEFEGFLRQAVISGLEAKRLTKMRLRWPRL